MGDFLRTLRTVRYLRPSQMVARASFTAERLLVAQRPGLLERRYARRLKQLVGETGDAEWLWRWPPAPLDPAARAEPARLDDVVAGRFTFLNDTREVHNWASPGASRLWLFQLHGFRYAIDLAVAARRGRGDAVELLGGLVESWLEQHPIDASDAWHPFVVSERLIAWLVARDLLRGQAVPRDAILMHAAFLAEHLETDVGGNHLLKNLVALLLAGCAFNGPRAELWRQQASGGLEGELNTQILSDGGHYERSPMYHLLVLADLLTALFPAGRQELPISVALADAVRRMQSVARTLVHPDGDIPLLNDAVLGEAPLPAQLIGPSTEAAPVCLPDTGYVLLSTSKGVLIADCGPPGPDDLPAHIHADALSFELSIGQQRVLVDGGIFDYVAGDLRDRLRGTAAHNAVEVDGLDQSEVWGAFRAGRRARVQLSRCSSDVVVAAHDGYARIGVRHERRIDALEGTGWRVLDTLTGDGSHTADARLRLHSALHWQKFRGRWLVCDARGAEVLAVEPIGAPEVTLERGIYAERFSQLQQVQVLRLRRHGRPPFVFGCWLLLPGAAPRVI